MNGPTTSVIGTIAAMLAASIVGWLASRNIIPAADVTQDTALIGTVLVGAIGAAIVYFKAQMATKNAQIAAVNAIDGLKVVTEATPAATVTAAPVKDEVKIAAVNAIDGVKVVASTSTAVPPVTAVPPILK